MPVNDPSRYPLRVNAQRRKKRLPSSTIQVAVLLCIIGTSGVFILPQAITLSARVEQSQPLATTADSTASTNDYSGALTGKLASSAQFPISVDPATKTIKANPVADAIFAQSNDRLSASAGTVADVLNWVAAIINNTSLYQSLAAADGHLIRIQPGYRKEQVLAQLVTALHWNKQEQQEFLAEASSQTPGMSEGMFAPGSYVVDSSMTPSNVAAIMDLQFDKTILSHYSSTTASQVPLSEAITVASLLEREAKGPEDMRVISGIIWNRLFKGMNLQIDATLQYAKGQNKAGSWWGTVVPKDKYVASAYNTYAHAGLPPGPIANPSVAAVLAALNPVKTSCVFYFHDKYGNFHCSDTYAQHVAMLKKYYGQGK